MPWIYFDRHEPAAPSINLPALDGSLVEPADFRGVSGLVLFFAHGSACPQCRLFIDALDQAAGAVHVQGAEALVIQPEALAQPALSHLPQLLDQQGLLRRAYAAIFEFDVTGKAMLFILNQHGAPYRAWVGDEPDPDLLPQMLQYLESASLLCPE